MKFHQIIYMGLLLFLAGCASRNDDFDYRESMFNSQNEMKPEEMKNSEITKTPPIKEKAVTSTSFQEADVTEKEPLSSSDIEKVGSDSEEKMTTRTGSQEEEKEEHKETKEENLSNLNSSESMSFSERNLKTDYSEYSNELRNWWYHVPKTLNEGISAKINKDVKSLIEKYDALWQYSTGEKIIYWTMDEGYEFENNTTEILNVAKEKGVPITFFVTGDFIRQRPDLLKRMDEEGHLICNHSNKHLNGPKALSESDEKWVRDITVVEEMVRKTIGKDIQPFFRPPEGAYSERCLKILNDLGYRTVFWSFAYKDWETANQPDQKYAKEKILGQLHDGSILLIHAVSKTNVAIFSEMIDEIRARGFRFETVDKIPPLSPDGY